jgi:aminomethyltransferase
MRQTPLYETHVGLGARVVDFAGWAMPIQYPQGISEEHLAVRNACGLFDVSHMGEVRVTGAEATAFLQYVTLNDPAKLQPGRGQYSMLPNDRGGLIDDLYVYCDNARSYLVVCNASNTGAVGAHLRHLVQDFDVRVSDESDDWALVAVQGPQAAALVGRFIPEADGLKKNRFADTSVDGAPVRIARTGYTGEDGFEVFCRPDRARSLWDMLIGAGAMPCGLGARDTLRLEAGFPLYGHELTDETNPLCTDYAWVVKDKPHYGREAMHGASCERRLVGLTVTGRGIPRQGYAVYHQDTVIGEVTSGSISPLTKRGIAMAWLERSFSDVGQEVTIEVRAQRVPATVTKPPFFP